MSGGSQTRNVRLGAAGVVPAAGGSVNTGAGVGAGVGIAGVAVAGNTACPSPRLSQATTSNRHNTATAHSGLGMVMSIFKSLGASNGLAIAADLDYSFSMSFLEAFTGRFFRPVFRGFVAARPSLMRLVSDFYVK
jgi:hypothetical protein